MELNVKFTEDMARWEEAGDDQKQSRRIRMENESQPKIYCSKEVSGDFGEIRVSVLWRRQKLDWKGSYKPFTRVRCIRILVMKGK